MASIVGHDDVVKCLVGVEGIDVNHQDEVQPSQEELDEEELDKEELQSDENNQDCDSCEEGHEECNSQGSDAH